MALMVYPINLVLFVLFSNCYNSNEQLIGTEFRCRLVNAYLEGSSLKDSLEEADEYRKKINIENDLRVESVYFMPFDFLYKSETCNSKFAYGILKFNLISRSNYRGFSEVLLVDSSFQLLDFLRIERFKLVKSKKTFTSEVWLGDSLRIDQYAIRNQDLSMHPYMSKIEKSIFVSIDTNKFKFKRKGDYFHKGNQ